jgi:outer membrane receptor protein involved in Fe transport
LKQVRSETFETGIRGKLAENIEWNASVYRTDLQDDIYFVSFRPERSFFQNIGDTRRQGLEMGLKGKAGKATFAVNYSLTDATFQSDFRMGSPNNSEAGTTQFYPGCNGNFRPAYCDGISDFQQIKVKKGNRMPGVPLHNLNASISYEVTPDWTVGLTAIMHSSAFVRGNENNAHRQGPAKPIEAECTTGQCLIERPDFKYSGKTPGYAVFNFNTAYKITRGLTAGLQINNLFDRTYYSGGRLGINAFAPSIHGAIDPVSGFNYNTSDWTSSTFLAPGAPRSAYFTLTYDFDMGK